MSGDGAETTCLTIFGTPGDRFVGFCQKGIREEDWPNAPRYTLNENFYFGDIFFM
jgi:hypothetical protein